MKNIILFLGFIFLLSCNNNRVGGRKILIDKIDSLEIELKNTYKPGFGSMMSSIQTHYSKLWYAGLNKNWKLAVFEIHEIKELLEDVNKYQGDRKEIEFISMITPSVKDLSSIIEDKDFDRFKNGYIQLTKSCNDCHIKTNYEFIKISVPKSNPFSSQEF